MKRLGVLAGALAGLSWASPGVAADFEIRVKDAVGTGFVDPTPVAPVGGNAGATLGDQRRIAFEYAASIWGELIQSPVTIVVDAQFSPLTCSATSAVLGSAGTNFVFQDFPGAPAAGTWHHSALADSLAGVDLAPGLADISAQFNSDLDSSDCLGGVGWYYGLDGQAGGDIDLVQVLLHELGHGLGFSNFVNEETGRLLLGEPDVYSSFTLDTERGRTWSELSDAERVVSAKNTHRVVWSGVRVSRAAPHALASGVPLLRTTSDDADAWYPVAVANFGAALSNKPIVGVVRAPAGSELGCANALPSGQQGVVLYLDLGSCGAETQAKAAEAAGAAALVVGMTSAGAPLKPLTGFENVHIPVVSVSQADAARLKQAAGAGLLADIREDLDVLIGADPEGHVQLNAPDPVRLGSSISHWDPVASPNLLMEPYATQGLAHTVDLSLPLLEDIGWNATATVGPGGTGGAGGSSDVGGANAGGAPSAGGAGAGPGGSGPGGSGPGGSGPGGSGPGGSGPGGSGPGGSGPGGSGPGGSGAGGAGELPGGKGPGGSPSHGGFGGLPAPPPNGAGAGGSGARDPEVPEGVAGAAGAAGGQPEPGVRVIVLAPQLDCGCRAAGAGSGPGGWSFGGLLAFAGLLRLRRVRGG